MDILWENIQNLWKSNSKRIKRILGLKNLSRILIELHNISSKLEKNIQIERNSKWEQTNENDCFLIHLFRRCELSNQIENVTQEVRQFHVFEFRLIDNLDLSVFANNF